MFTRLSIFTRLSKEYYKVIETDLSKQQKLDADLKAI